MCASEGKDFPKEEIECRPGKTGSKGRGQPSSQGGWSGWESVEAEAARGNLKQASSWRLPGHQASGSSEQEASRIGLLFKTTPVAVLRTGLELMLRLGRPSGGKDVGRGQPWCWVQPWRR